MSRARAVLAYGARMLAAALMWAAAAGLSAQTPVTIDEGSSAPPARREVVIVEPILPMIFFDTLSAEPPARYHRYALPEQTLSFSDTAMEGITPLELHYRALDVIGYRMRRHSATTIEVVAATSESSNYYGLRQLLTARASVVVGYLTEIWGIDTSRITIRLDPNPWGVRSARDDNQFAEYRNVAIRTDSWELLRPITLRTDGAPYVGPDTSGPHGPTTVVVPLRGYPYDRFEPGAFNMRVIREIILPLISRGTMIDVVGHTDVIGLMDRNLYLSTRRADTTGRLINEALPQRERRRIATRGVGEEEPLFANELPERLLLNRVVVVRLRTP